MPLDYLTEQEQRHLLKHVRSVNCPLAKRDAAWIELLIETGMRVGEFSRITLADAREALRSGWLFVPAENRKGVQVGPKDEKKTLRFDHKLKLFRVERELLQTLIELHIAALAGQLELLESSPLVYSRRCTALSVRAYQQRLEYWCDQAGMKLHASPHTLRHTCAMNIMRHSTADNPLSLVTARLGHLNKRTAEIYTEMRRAEMVQSELEAVQDRRHQRRPGKRQSLQQLRTEYQSRNR